MERSRIVIISYHSLEDRIVKQWSKYGTIDIHNKTDSSPSAPLSLSSKPINKHTNQVAEDAFSGNSNRIEYKKLLLRKQTGASSSSSSSSSTTRSGNLMNKYASSSSSSPLHPWRIVNKEVISPDGMEVAANNRSRSAKLRVVEYVA